MSDAGNIMPDGGDIMLGGRCNGENDKFSGGTAMLDGWSDDWEAWDGEGYPS